MEPDLLPIRGGERHPRFGVRRRLVPLHQPREAHHGSAPEELKDRPVARLVEDLAAQVADQRDKYQQSPKTYFLIGHTDLLDFGRPP
jgi:hypothetical protein